MSVSCFNVLLLTLLATKSIKRGIRPSSTDHTTKKGVAVAPVIGSYTRNNVRPSNYRLHYRKAMSVSAVIQSDMRKDVRPLVTD